MREDRKGENRFGGRLRELRLAKGWSQHQLAKKAGCTNSNISYLENDPAQHPRLETVEALAAALDWPAEEARRLAGYSEREANLSHNELENDFRLALFGYKKLSSRGRELVREQIEKLIDFVAECEGDRPAELRPSGFERQLAEDTPIEVPEMTLEEFNRYLNGPRPPLKPKK